jgi:vesicle-fusing ATPase
MPLVNLAFVMPQVRWIVGRLRHWFADFSISGILLYGPPGTGKSLLATQIGKVLDASEPQIVNGYDLVRKPASATWDAIRNLFSATDKEDAWKSRLRVLVIEHLDVICKRYKATDKEDDGDNVVSQILSKVCSVRYCSHHSLSHVKRWAI